MYCMFRAQAPGTAGRRTDIRLGVARRSLFTRRVGKGKKKHLVLSSAILIGSSPLSCLLVDRGLDQEFDPHGRGR
jgi:hypothetical protein